MKSRSKTMMLTLFLIGIIGTLYLIFPTITNAQQEEKIFVTHSGAIVKTSGEVLDPLYTESTVEFDPMEFLREFNYGQVSKLPDTLSHFFLHMEPWPIRTFQ